MFLKKGHLPIFLIPVKPILLSHFIQVDIPFGEIPDNDHQTLKILK